MGLVSAAIQEQEPLSLLSFLWQKLEKASVLLYFYGCSVGAPLKIEPSMYKRKPYVGPWKDTTRKKKASGSGVSSSKKFSKIFGPHLIHKKLFAEQLLL
jgi:hypothetical protein